jgi:hypothetical protein
VIPLIDPSKVNRKPSGFTILDVLKSTVIHGNLLTDIIENGGKVMAKAKK